VKPLPTKAPPEPTPDLPELLDRACAGDQRAFALLYNANASKVYGLLTRLVGPVAEREDLLQEVFIRFHRALPSYRRDAALATFLHRIAVRVAYDHLRRRGRQPKLSAQPVNEVAGSLPSAADGSAHREEVGEVLALLAQLKPKQRIALVLRVALDLSYPEIADLVGCRPATARMRVAAANRALDKLTARKRRSS
jgi:RNA polymerase sigma-70 factor (ECF subfamily)